MRIWIFAIWLSKSLASATGRAVLYNASTGRQGHAQHDPERFGFDTASVMVSAPPSPQSAAQISLRIDSLVSDGGTGACGLPWLGILARWDDSMGIAGGNRLGVFSRVIRPICSEAADVLIGWDLIKQFGQSRSSPILLVVTSTARTSSVSSSIPPLGSTFGCACRAVVRHVWIATSLKLCCRLRLPLGSGAHAILGSNQPLTNASMCCQPVDRQRSTLLETVIVRRPVCGLVLRCGPAAHTSQLLGRIHNMNPLNRFVQHSLGVYPNLGDFEPVFRIGSAILLRHFEGCCTRHHSDRAKDQSNEKNSCRE
jgi:hypothetical protein